MIESENLVTLILQIYIGVGIAKAILAITGAYVAAWATNKFNQRPIWLLVVGYILAAIPVALLIWPKLLVAERWSFFVMYSRRSLIRQVAECYRESDQTKKEESA